MLCLVAQLCLILCDPMTVARQAPLPMGILQARILERVACLESNPGLSHHRQILYYLSHQGSPRYKDGSWQNRELEPSSRARSLVISRHFLQRGNPAPVLTRYLEFLRDEHVLNFSLSSSHWRTWWDVTISSKANPKTDPFEDQEYWNESAKWKQNCFFHRKRVVSSEDRIICLSIEKNNFPLISVTYSLWRCKIIPRLPRWR